MNINTLTTNVMAGASQLASKIPGVGNLNGRAVSQNADLEQGRTDEAGRYAIRQAAPVTGGSCFTGLGAGLGAVAGLATFGIGFALSTSTLWGVGAGLWVEGDKQDRDQMETAGRIMVIVGASITGACTIVGGIVGAIAGGASASH